MPPSRAEFLAYQESLGTPYKPSLDVALGMIKTAAVSFDHLTNDANWDRFLSYIQAELETAKKDRERYKEMCTYLFSDSSLREAQCQYHRCDAQVQILEKVIMLPTQLKEQYDGLRKA